MNDNKFSFVATITTIMLSIIIASVITLSQSYIGTVKEGIKTSIYKPGNERLLVPFYNTHDSKIAQESKALTNIFITFISTNIPGSPTAK